MSHSIILSLSLSLAILFITLPSSSADTQLIIETCKKIAQAQPSLGGNYQICVDFLRSDPRSATATLEGLAEISFKLTQKKTVAIESQVKSLLGSSKFDASVKKALTDCAEMYSNAEDSIGEALKALKEKDYSAANIHTSAAEDAPSDCEDGFKDQTSPLTKVNDEIRQFYGIALVFTNMFH